MVRHMQRARCCFQAADKSVLTGWGSTTAAFHSKYVGFVGLALFSSDDPASLPWTTSKRGLNREALVFQRARNVMAGVAKPIITFLNDLYPSDPAEDPAERQVAEGVQQTDFRVRFYSRRQGPLRRHYRQRPKARSVCQFDAKKTEIARIKKRLRRPALSASEIGKLTFDHFT